MEINRKFLVNPPLETGQFIEEIAQNFSISTPTTDKLQRIYYDTFDWRLYQDGKCLCWEEGVLTLAELNDSSKAITTPFPDHLKIKFSQDLPEGVLRKSVAPIIQMRALLSLAVAMVDRISFNTLNKDTKSTTRLQLEELRLHTSESKPIITLSVEPIKGYQKEAKKIYAFLAHANSNPADNNSILESIMAEAGHIPGSYSTKPSADFSPETSTDLAAVAIFKNQIDTMKINEAGIIADIDSEFLHDFRVALRRSRAGLGQIKGAFSAEVTRRYKDELKEIGLMTNRLRDLDVYLLKKDYYSAMLPDSLQAKLNHLFLLLAKEREQEQKKVVDRLKSSTYKNNMADWSTFLDHYVSGGKDSGPQAQKPVLGQAKKYILKAWQKVINSGRLITVDSPDEELHNLRLHCKKLRYLMEFFTSLFPEKCLKSLIKQLKRLQDNLGDFNDLCVQQKTLQEYLIKQVPGNRQQVGIAAAIGGLIANLNFQQQATRKVFNKTFQEFDQEPNNSDFIKLFGKGK